MGFDESFMLSVRIYSNATSIPDVFRVKLKEHWEEMGLDDFSKFLELLYEHTVNPRLNAFCCGSYKPLFKKQYFWHKNCLFY